MFAKETRELLFLPEDETQENFSAKLWTHEPAHKAWTQAAPGIDFVIHYAFEFAASTSAELTFPRRYQPGHLLQTSLSYVSVRVH